MFNMLSMLSLQGLPRPDVAALNMWLGLRLFVEGARIRSRFVSVVAGRSSVFVETLVHRDLSGANCLCGKLCGASALCLLVEHSSSASPSPTELARSPLLQRRMRKLCVPHLGLCPVGSSAWAPHSSPLNITTMCTCTGTSTYMSTSKYAGRCTESSTSKNSRATQARTSTSHGTSGCTECATDRTCGTTTTTSTRASTGTSTST